MWPAWEGSQGSLVSLWSRSLLTVRQDLWESKWRFEWQEYLFLATCAVWKASSAFHFFTVPRCLICTVPRIFNQNACSRNWHFILISVVWFLCCGYYTLRGRQGVFDRKRNSCCVEVECHTGHVHPSEVMSVGLSGGKLQLFCWTSSR